MDFLSIAARVLCIADLVLCWYALYRKEGWVAKAKAQRPDFEIPAALFRYDGERLNRCFFPKAGEDAEPVHRILLYGFALLPGVGAALLLCAALVMKTSWVQVGAYIAAAIALVFSLGENGLLVGALRQEPRRDKLCRYAGACGLVKWVALGLWLVALFASLFVSAAKL